MMTNTSAAVPAPGGPVLIRIEVQNVVLLLTVRQAADFLARLDAAIAALVRPGAP